MAHNRAPGRCGDPPMTTFCRDARHALRSALRRPGVPLVVVLTLAVGIGANSAIFTYLMEVYRARIPVPKPDRVFWIETGTVERPGGMSSYLDAEAYREATAELGSSAAVKASVLHGLGVAILSRLLRGIGAVANSGRPSAR